jgi:hypothetical protein
MGRRRNVYPENNDHMEINTLKITDQGTQALVCGI